MYAIYMEYCDCFILHTNWRGESVHFMYVTLGFLPRSYCKQSPWLGLLALLKSLQKKLFVTHNILLSIIWTLFDPNM